MKSLTAPPSGKNVWCCWVRNWLPKNVGWTINCETYGPLTLPSPGTNCPRNRFCGVTGYGNCLLAALLRNDMLFISATACPTNGFVEYSVNGTSATRDAQ